MKKILSRLNHIKYRKIIWVLAVSETIHNIEEAIWLPDWSRTAGFFHPPVSPFEFRIAVLMVTLAFYWIIYYFSTHETMAARYLMAGALVVVLFNVFFPHLAAALATFRFVPGAVSGVVLNIPVAVYLLWRGVTEGEFNRRILAVGAVAVALIMLPLMAASFALGRIVEKMIL